MNTFYDLYQQHTHEETDEEKLIMIHDIIGTMSDDEIDKFGIWLYTRFFEVDEDEMQYIFSISDVRRMVAVLDSENYDEILDKIDPENRFIDFGYFTNDGNIDWDQSDYYDNYDQDNDDYYDDYDDYYDDYDDSDYDYYEYYYNLPESEKEYLNNNFKNIISEKLGNCDIDLDFVVSNAKNLNESMQNLGFSDDEIALVERVSRAFFSKDFKKKMMRMSKTGVKNYRQLQLKHKLNRRKNVQMKIKRRMYRRKNKMPLARKQVAYNKATNSGRHIPRFIFGKPKK